MEEIKAPVNAEKISLEEGVLDVLGTLPKPLQDFLTGPERDSISVKISNKYNLHADQAGEFQRAFLFMLMGIFNPEAFVKDLQAVGIDTETVKLLANEVNEEVFKPLRAKERGEKVINQIPPAPSVLPTPAVNVAAITPQPTETAPREQPAYAGARPQPLTPFNLPGAEIKPTDLFRSQTRMVAHESPPVVVPIESPAPRIASPLPSYAPKVESTPAPITPVVHPEKPPEVRSMPPVPVVSVMQPEPPRLPVPSFSSPPPQAAPARPEYKEAPTGGTLRTMATDMLAMNEHREPAPVAYKGSAYTPPVIMQAAPPPPEAPKRPPAIPTMPASLAEFAPSRTPLEPLAPASVPTIPTKTSVTPIPSNELVKGYATDPYREAI